MDGMSISVLVVVLLFMILRVPDVDSIGSRYCVFAESLILLTLGKLSAWRIDLGIILVWVDIMDNVKK